MKTAYISIKFHQDYRNKETVDKITNILEKIGFYTFCIIRDEEECGKKKLNPKELMQITFDKINMSDLVIVDLTEKGVGIGIEAGYAFSLDIPIITIAKKGTEISNTLYGISHKVMIYDDISNIEESLVKEIENLIK